MLLFALLLYPLLLAQIGLLVNRAPSYVAGYPRLGRRRGASAAGGARLGLRRREAARPGGGAGRVAMLGWVAGTLTRIVGSGFALFSVISLVIVTPVVAFYLLRDWRRAVARLDSWLPRRYTGVYCGRRRARWTASFRPGCGGRRSAACCWRRSTRWR